tara:strand:- start:152 stop:1033 length:882 start_codon:yes stop_codon:yes gene_type:complete
MYQDKILVSVCSRKYNDNLINLLKNINISQRYKKLNIEILIVFNSFSVLDKSKKNKIANILTNIKFSIDYEKKIGISFVRNKVLKLIKKKDFKYGCFLDDDCKIKKNFFLSHLNFIKINKCDIVGGPQIYFSTKKYFEIFQRNFPQKRNIKWVSTNNVFFKKKILERKINFSLNVSKYGFGEDQLFFNKLYNQGFKIKWNNNPIFENVSNNMNSIKWFYNRNYNYGLTSVLIDKELHKKSILFMIYPLKIFFYLLRSLIYLILIPLNIKKYYYLSLGYLIRFFGRIIGFKNLL